MPVTKLIPQNYEAFRGDTAVFNMVVRDQDDAVKDITGSTVRFVMAKRAGAAPAVDLSTAGGITITDAVNGALQIIVPSSDTEPLIGAYLFEVEVTDVAGRVSTVAYGTITMRKDSAV